MKNRISKELKAWVRAVHGRRKNLAQHCGVSGGSVDSWLHERNGIAPRHHSKIFEFTGIHAVEMRI